MSLPQRKVWFAGIFLLLSVTGILVGVVLVRQRQVVETEAKYSELNLVVANLTDKSLSVWWRTPEPEAGCLTITDLTGGGGTQEVCSQEQTASHVVDVSGLTPATRYKLRVKTETQELSLSPYFGAGLSTRKTLTNIQPSLARGRIADFNQAPVAGATVFIAPNLVDRMYFPVVAVTDDQGYYQADLGVLSFQYPPEFSQYFVEVADRGGIKLIETVVDKHKIVPLPTINVSTSQ